LRGAPTSSCSIASIASFSGKDDERLALKLTEVVDSLGS
jgi:hypothetical protein